MSHIESSYYERVDWALSNDNKKLEIDYPDRPGAYEYIALPDLKITKGVFYERAQGIIGYYYDTGQNASVQKSDFGANRVILLHSITKDQGIKILQALESIGYPVQPFTPSVNGDLRLSSNDFNRLLSDDLVRTNFSPSVDEYEKMEEPMSFEIDEKIPESDLDLF